MTIMSFLVILLLEFETAKSQILFNSEISASHDTFTRILCTKNYQSIISTLVSCNDNGWQGNRRGSKRGANGNGDRNSRWIGEVALEEIVCYY